MKLGVAPELAKQPCVSLDTCPSTWGSLECFCVFNFVQEMHFFKILLAKARSQEAMLNGHSYLCVIQNETAQMARTAEFNTDQMMT